MKPFLALLFALSISLSAAEPLKFITITKETNFDNGRGCSAGEVEVVLGEDAGGYLIWGDDGQKYRVPKSNATATSAEDAALRLVQLRQSLFKEINALNEDLDAVTAPAATVDTRKTTGERARERKAKRDAAAKASVDSYYEWKLRNFLDRR